LPTTTRSSERARARPGTRRETGTNRRTSPAVVALLAVAASLVSSACVSKSSPSFFELAPEAPQHRVEETRFFETRDSTELLSASAAVLQDLGFHVEESVRELGFLRAAKERSAREYGQEVGRVLLLIVSLGKLMEPIDLHQKIAASLVARPADPGGTRQEVRITFYRVIWKGDGFADRNALPPGEQSMELVRDPVVYQQFFAKLSKAVVLEAYTL
jgi:hypothetical protein